MRFYISEKEKGVSVWLLKDKSCRCIINIRVCMCEMIIIHFYDGITFNIHNSDFTPFFSFVCLYVYVPEERERNTDTHSSKYKLLFNIWRMIMWHHCYHYHHRVKQRVLCVSVYSPLSSFSLIIIVTRSEHAYWFDLIKPFLYMFHHNSIAILLPSILL